MGIPIDKLVVATNENNVLAEFFATGTYRVRSGAETHETSSPSMDISKASNFERFVFDLVGRDGDRVRGLFGEALATDGSFSVTPEEFDRVASFGFLADTSTHADRVATIEATWAQHRSLVDPHTADGLTVAARHVADGVPMIVLETALPAKFAATIHEAIGREPEIPERLAGLLDLPQRVRAMDADVSQVKAFIAETCA